MDSPSSNAHAARLRQLQGYLAQDPANAHLLAEVCAAGLAAGDHDAALRAVEAAEDLGLDRGPWLHRRAHVAMAKGDWESALSALGRARSLAGNEPAIVHDIAWVQLCAGQTASCRDTVAPLLDETNVDDDMRARLQLLWLRALHHLGQLDDAWQWIEQQRAQRRLHPRSMGVAALIAIDVERFPAAETLASEALRHPQPVAEALVAAAYVALARQQPDRAENFLLRALEIHPRDGRTWSARGLASLQAGDIAAARRHLEQAVRTLPRHVGTWHALGWACLLLQDLAAARAAFDRALELDRNFGESHAAVALMCMLEGNEADMEHHLRVAERLHPRGVTAGYVRALHGGALRDAASVRALAHRLLARPGFFGGLLHDSLPWKE